MSSDIFMFDSSFFSNPFSTFSDSSIDALQAVSVPETYRNPLILQNPVDESNYLDEIASTLISSSPPSKQIEDFSLFQTTHFQDVPNFANQFADFPVKTEEYNEHYDMVQRRSSSISHEGKVEFLFQTQIDTLMETQIRMVCSTGELHVQANHGLSSSPLSTESSFMEKENFKVGRYSAEVRREKIHRYRVKRNQRNFNKTIKVIKSWHLSTALTGCKVVPN